MEQAVALALGAVAETTREAASQRQREKEKTERKTRAAVASNVEIAAEPKKPREPCLKRLRIINEALDRAWGMGLATRPSLDPITLVRAATKVSGEEPDNDEIGWRARLECLCGDLREHARLNELGVTLAYGQLVSVLASRFRTHALWRRHPEIKNQPFAAPIIIVGQMRSGSTRMQRLLACDPRLTFTRFYESWNPVPSSTRPFGLDDRKAKAWLSLNCAKFLNPKFAKFHPTAWNAPDEEIGLHSLSIFGTAYEAQWRLPNFARMIENDEGIEVYSEFKRLLQTLRWLRRGSDDRPWILKVPQFTQDLPALLRTFPDARIIYLTRDPSDVIVSSAALVSNQMSIQSDHVDPLWVHREWSRKVQLREERISAAQASAGVDHVTVCYESVSNDWATELSRVYEMIGLTLEFDLRQKMSSFLANS